MERKLIRGKTTEQKFDSVEKILQSYRGKLGRKIVGLIPPVVLMSEKREIDPDGRVLAGIVPFDGTLRVIAFAMREQIAKEVSIDVEIQRPDGSVTLKSFKIKRKMQVLEINFPIETGDVLRIFADPHSARDILVSALIHANLGEAERTTQMLDRVAQLDEQEETDAVQNAKE